MIMHPLDLIKTRFQLQNNVISTGQSQQHYAGVRDCARKMYHQEGLFSFWKGILPPILVETPKRAWKFFTFEQFQKIFLFGSEKPGVMVGNLWNSWSICSYFSSRRTLWQGWAQGSLRPLSSILLKWWKLKCNQTDPTSHRRPPLGRLD